METSVMYEQLLQGLVEDLREVYSKEVAEKEFMAHEEFKDDVMPNIARIHKMTNEAMTNFRNTLSLAANLHGEEAHERVYKEEKDFLYTVTDPEQQATAEAPGWWKD